MIILHAGEYDGSLLLWGETPREKVATCSTASGRDKSSTTGNHYPFGASTGDLNNALKRAGLALKPTARETRRVEAWLPTRGQSPAPSSSLVADPPRSRARAKLVPWGVSGYALPAAETVKLLVAATGKRTLAKGVVVGPDLAFWADALRFAGSVTARQQFLPGMADAAGEYQARWEPIFIGKDAERLSGLASRMPGAARALSDEGSAAPPDRPAVAVLGQVVAMLVDHLVRTASPNVPPEAARRKKKPAFASIHDAWLHSLKSSDGVIRGRLDDLLELGVVVREWRRPIAVSASSPYRICFRLEEPDLEERRAPAGFLGGDGDNPGDEWYVRYLLQPHEDPSLLIPVEAAWQSGGSQLSGAASGGGNVREFLLTSLGQASGICPPVAASLEQAKPAGYGLDSGQAHEFLTGYAAALEQAGYGVMLPAWWTRKGTKARLSVQATAKSPAMQGGSGLSLETIVQFDWEVALGDQQVTLGELEALAELKAPLVRFRGQWVELNAEEIQAAIDFWKARGTDEASLRDVIRMALGAGEARQGLEFTGLKADGWIGRVLGQLEDKDRFEELPPPEGFSGELRPYQVRGYSWLSFLSQLGLGACLADDMGLGKTVQTLALIQREWRAGGGRPVLLVCPTSVMNNWRKEAARFTPGLPLMVHHGAGRKRGEAFHRQAKGKAMVVTSYGTLQRDIGILGEISWSGVVLDEAQNIKNPETRQARAARALPADYRIALTGTPMENNVGDLWSVMEFLNPGFLGTQGAFKRNFFTPIQAEGDQGAAEQLKRATGPFILRRHKTDGSIISDLPEKLEMKEYCSLTREQASLYASVLKEMEEALEEAEGMQRRGIVLGVLSKLKQVCNHPAQFLGDNSVVSGRSGKLTRLTEMLEDVIEAGEKALVFSQFSEMGGLLRRHVQETVGREALFLHGGVPRRERDRMVERFQGERDGPPVFVLSLKAGGTGLNLTAANHVFHFDRWWNPAVENQATDRAFRIGQHRNVQVHKFICAGTLEERIDEMIERKQEVAEQIVGAGEDWLTELSNDGLREILALGREAVGV